jgi:hypothetical protein
VDPLVDETGQPYAYAGDDPANQPDPTGLCAGPDGICTNPATGTLELNTADLSTDNPCNGASNLSLATQYEEYVGVFLQAHSIQLEQEVLDQGGGWSGFFQGLGLVAGGIAAVTGVGDILDISIAGIEGESLSDVAYASGAAAAISDAPGCFIDRNALACTGFALAGLGEIGNYLYDSNKLVQGLAGALGWAAATSGTVLDGTLSFDQWAQQNNFNVRTN